MLTLHADGFDSARLAAIPARMRSFVDKGDVAGTVVLVARKGKVELLDAQGFANIETRTPMRTDTVFQIMSMTKPVTALAVVQCAEAGLLRLDDPIDRHLPELRNLKVRRPDGSTAAPASRPTIRQLLTHTAGFDSIDPGGLDDDAKRKISLADYAKLLPGLPLVGEPGQAIRYSGTGYATLGRIVEVVTGKTLDAYMQERIFGPLEMKDTFFFAPESIRPRLAFFYGRDNGRLVPMEHDPYRIGAKYANPAGGLYSTAADMVKILEALNAGGVWKGRRILSPAGVRAMTTVQTGDLTMDGSPALGYALGFTVVRTAAGQSSLKPIGSYGHTGAYGTEFWADPQTGIAAVFMAQGFESTEARKTFNTMVNAAFTG
jgi:CubicO group peptidase (beta-lactamase class C family)